MPRRSAGPAPHCRNCGYSLYGLPKPRCPECGTKHGSVGDVVRWRQHWRIAAGAGGRRSHVGLNLASMVLLGVGSVVLIFAMESFSLLACAVVPALSLIIPASYYHWSTAIPGYSIWLPVGILWTLFGISLYRLFNL